MSASTTYTFEGTAENPARRPSLDDIGGDELEEHPQFPPNKSGKMPYADQLNERARQIRGAAGTGAFCTLHVRFAAGAPTIESVQARNSALSAGDFTLTDNADGDTTIEWLSYKLPPLVLAKLSLYQDVEIDRQRVYSTTSSSPSTKTAVRVKTKLGATPTDCAFVVELS